jgi:alpha-amylase
LELSDDVGYRFSNRSWSGFPLYADAYANWIGRTWGDMLLLGWDYETFGEHHRLDSGIFEFARALPAQLSRSGVTTYTISELIDRQSAHANHLPLPIYPSTWAGSGGMEFFLGNEAQKVILQLMGHVYGMAKLTENPELIDLALWLAQSDNLHLIQWYGRSGPEAEVSAYFTPSEWWALGPNGVIYEQQQVYLNTLRALEPYLPVRILRQPERKAVRSLRSRETKLEPEAALHYAARSI